MWMVCGSNTESTQKKNRVHTQKKPSVHTQRKNPEFTPKEKTRVHTQKKPRVHTQRKNPEFTPKEKNPEFREKTQSSHTHRKKNTNSNTKTTRSHTTKPIHAKKHQFIQKTQSTKKHHFTKKKSAKKQVQKKCTKPSAKKKGTKKKKQKQKMFAVYLVLCPSRTLCVTGWSACAGHHRLLHCVHTGVPRVSFTGPTGVPSYAQAGWHRRQSANPLLAAADCAASCAVYATIITRAAIITPPRSNTRVVDFGRLGWHCVASHTFNV